jgi:hypothetical protein
MKFAVVALMFVFVAGCASPSASRGTVFKSNETEMGVFGSSMQGR